MKKLLLLVFLVLLIPNYSSSDEYFDKDYHGDHRGVSKHDFYSDIRLREQRRIEKTIAEFVMTKKEHRMTMLSDELAKRHKDLSMYLDTVFSDYSYFKMIEVKTLYNRTGSGAITAHLYKKTNGKVIVDVVHFILIKEYDVWKLGPIKKNKSFYIQPIQNK